MAERLIDGEFQSDKYPTCPRGKVPLSCKDVTAQDLLWEYAQRRRAVDADFADDLEAALHIAGYKHDVPTDAHRKAAEEVISEDRQNLRVHEHAVEVSAAIIARHCPDRYAEGKAAGLEEAAGLIEAQFSGVFLQDDALSAANTRTALAAAIHALATVKP
jgi:hypothetical protein